MPDAYFEAYNFFTSSTMLDVDDDVQAKKFADSYTNNLSGRNDTTILFRIQVSLTGRTNTENKG